MTTEVINDNKNSMTQGQLMEEYDPLKKSTIHNLKFDCTVVKCSEM